MMFQAWIHPTGEAQPRPIGLPQYYRSSAKGILQGWEGRQSGLPLSWHSLSRYRDLPAEGLVARDALGTYIVYPDGMTPPLRLDSVIPHPKADTPQPAAEEEWDKLYRWLGEQAEAAFAYAEEHEQSVSLDENVGQHGMAEGFLMVRARMRGADRSLCSAPRCRGERGYRRGGH